MIFKAKYIGYIDKVADRKISGWAYNMRNPKDAVPLQVLANGVVVSEGMADIFREDLKCEGYGEGNHAFEIEIPEEHWGDVYTVSVKGADYALVDNTALWKRRFFDMFCHIYPTGLPPLESGFTVADVDADALAIAEDGIAKWRELKANASQIFVGKDNMWSFHIQRYQSDVIALLDEGDKESVARYFVDSPINKLTFGILQGDEHYKALKSTTDAGHNNDACLIWDALLSFAEYLQVVTVETPGQIHWGDNFYLNVNDTRKAIEAKIGIPIVVKHKCNGLFGLKVNKGILGKRDVNALYAAYRLKEIVGDDMSGKSVCEIGGGTGGVAYYANLLGCRDYTMVDLPIICLLQFFTLAHLLGRDKVDLVVTHDEWLASKAEIKIIPAWLFESRAIKGFDLVFNMDSFPEMGDAVVTEYLNAIPKKSRMLYSINQEAAGPLTPDISGPKQAVVGKLLRRHGKYTRVFRYTNWLLKGYVDELHQCK